MAKLTLTLDMDNDAFVDGPQNEVIRILKSVGIDIAQGIDDGTLKDVNGNTVGSYEVTGKESKATESLDARAKRVWPGLKL